MKHKLYTTYLSNLKNVPESCKIVIVMRFPPFIPKDSDAFHCIELSPTGDLLMEYKKDHDFEKFEKKLWDQWNKDKKAQLRLKQLEYTLDNFNDVCLICCEKDLNICHRKILGEYFQFLGYNWEELKYDTEKQKGK